MSPIRHAALAAAMLACAPGAARALEYDQNVTPEYINGSGSVNGAFTVDRENGIELGLRAKVRYNALNQPENTFLSNGDGTYGPFATGGPTAPPGAVTRARWNYELTINTDFDGTSGLVLSDLTYRLSLDGDPSCRVSFDSWDPVTPGADPYNASCWDHSFGDNATPNSGGVEVNCASAMAAATYQAYLDTFIVLQQSWNYRFFPPGGSFDQDADATYDIMLEAFDQAGDLVASTKIQVIVGTGGDKDADRDGVCDSTDACPDSILTPTVMVGDCDTGVENRVDDAGCSIADQLTGCGEHARDRGAFVRCIARLLGGLQGDDVVDGRERGAIQRCAGRAVPR